MRQIKIYLSHAIRGSKGPKATDADMQANNTAAMRAASIVRQVLQPLEDQYECEIDVFCPAEHEEFVGIAFREGYLTIEQILDVDCCIVGKCQALIWYSQLGPSGGAEIEMKRARSQAIPIHELHSLGVDELRILENFMEKICHES